MLKKHRLQHRDHLLLLHPPPAEPALASREFALMEALCKAEGIPCLTSYANLKLPSSVLDLPQEVTRIVDGETWSLVRCVIIPLSHSQAELSIAVAAEIKRRHPEIRTYGFADMGLRRFTEAILVRSRGFDAIILEDFALLSRESLRNLTRAPADLLRVPGVLLLLPGGSLHLTNNQAQLTSVEPLAPDYQSFFQQFCESKYRDRLPIIAVPICRPNPMEASTEILALSRRHKIVRFDLGGVSFAPHDPSEALRVIAQIRSSRCYGISFQCRVRDWLNQKQVSLLALAGVTSAEIELLAFPSTALSELTVREINFRQMQLVRRLFASGIEVNWRLVLPRIEARAIEIEELADNLNSLHHLPAPKGLLQIQNYELSPAKVAARPEHGAPRGASERILPEGEVQVLVNAVGRWHDANATGLLTYARGPGFVRIFDRRTGQKEWTFIDLSPQQAQVFLSCEEGSSFNEIAALVPAAAANKLQRFLDHLVERRVMYHDGDSRYQSLPTRRKMEERWASADYS